ncbi:unnamed protein product [Dicrocoelium dendriticum]|nr:unnamed protein product [Dicrocoelium dendriticum]
MFSCAILNSAVPDPRKPRPNRPRKEPPSPATCSTVKTSMENSSVCTDTGDRGYLSTKLVIAAVTISLLVYANI